MLDEWGMNCEKARLSADVTVTDPVIALKIAIKTQLRSVSFRHLLHKQVPCYLPRPIVSDRDIDFGDET
jgi:hypothetical protein